MGTLYINPALTVSNYIVNYDPYNLQRMALETLECRWTNIYTSSQGTGFQFYLDGLKTGEWYYFMVVGSLMKNSEWRSVCDIVGCYWNGSKIETRKHIHLGNESLNFIDHANASSSPAWGSCSIAYLNGTVYGKLYYIEPTFIGGNLLGW